MPVPGSSPSPAPTLSSTYKPPPTDPAISLSKDIEELCNITTSPTPEAAPKFDFDSADLSPAEKGVLDQVAKCMTTGPLKGRRVKLVGRADPRGEQEYNMELGENRASNVRKYLGGLGVDATRTTLSSRGALDATGTDEGGWKKDRRVDITLL